MGSSSRDPAILRCGCGPTQRGTFWGDTGISSWFIPTTRSAGFRWGEEGWEASVATRASWPPSVFPSGALSPARKPEIDIVPVSLRDAVIELVRNSFVPAIVEAVGLQPRRLDLFSHLVQEVLIRRLYYPDGFDRLPEVCDRLVEDLRCLAQGAFDADADR